MSELLTGTALAGKPAGWDEGHASLLHDELAINLWRPASIEFGREFLQLQEEILAGVEQESKREFPDVFAKRIAIVGAAYALIGERARAAAEPFMADEIIAKATEWRHSMYWRQGEDGNWETPEPKEIREALRDLPSRLFELGMERILLLQLGAISCAKQIDAPCFTQERLPEVLIRSSSMPAALSRRSDDGEKIGLDAIVNSPIDSYHSSLGPLIRGDLFVKPEVYETIGITPNEWFAINWSDMKLPHAGPLRGCPFATEKDPTAAPYRELPSWWKENQFLMRLMWCLNVEILNQADPDLMRAA